MDRAGDGVSRGITRRAGHAFVAYLGRRAARFRGPGLTLYPAAVAAFALRELAGLSDYRFAVCGCSSSWWYSFQGFSWDGVRVRVLPNKRMQLAGALGLRNVD
jgi:hypothetical protein